VTLRPPGPSLATATDDDVVDVHQVARWLGCSPWTVWRSGLPFIEITPRVKRFRVGAIREWLKARTKGAA
jgi:hypothetical protein